MSFDRTVTEERIRVRYGETDQMGHAYYSNYLLWFEQARGAWCRDRGFTYKSWEELGIFLPVVEVHVRYRGEIKYDDWIRVQAKVTEVKRAAIQFSYEILNESTGNVTTTGFTWHVFMGTNRKSITIPESIREMLNRNPGEFERLD